jgi:hypothetical protein
MCPIIRVIVNLLQMDHSDEELKRLYKIYICYSAQFELIFLQDGGREDSRI